MLTKRASIAVYYISTTLLRRCQYPKVDIPASVFYNIASDHVAALSKYGDNFPHDRLQYSIRLTTAQILQYAPKLRHIIRDVVVT